MALYTGRLLMRGGNESDFDPDKMIPREWAVSTDKGIVRICFKPGVCIRMATYEAFEEDMAKIEEILEECQTIQEAVIRINTEVSQNADAVAEYTAQAKKYRDEAKTSADNAKTSETNTKTSEVNAKASETNAKVSEEHAQAVFESLPEDYNTLSKEFYEVAIKQKVSGEDIHVNDSANAKVRKFALFGKAKQNTTQGNQLLDVSKFPSVSNPSLGVTFTVDVRNGSVNVKGTSTGYPSISQYIELNKGTYILSGVEGSTKLLRARVFTSDTVYKDYVSGTPFTIDDTVVKCAIYIQADKGMTFDETFYPMLNEGSKALPWEKYTGGQPSPNPQYEQPIEVSGESYNLLENTATSQTINGVEFVVNEDKSVTVNGTATAKTSFQICATPDFDGTVKLTGCPKGGSTTTFCLEYSDYVSVALKDFGDGKTIEKFDYSNFPNARVDVRIEAGYTAENLTFYPMIRKASVKNDRYMPYGKGSVEVKSVGKNLLKNNAVSYTNNGITYSVNTDGSIRITGKRTATTYIDILGGIISDYKKEKLNLKDKFRYATSPYGRLKFRKTDGVYLQDLTTVQDAGCSEIGAVYFEVESNESVDFTYYPQIEYGDILTPYELYKETTATIPTENGLAGIKVDSGGNYTDSNGQQWICDEIVKYADGSGEGIQRVKKQVFDGSESFSASSLVSGRYVFGISDAKREQVPLCNLFMGAGEDKTELNKCYIDNNKTFFVNTDYATVDEFKSHLVNNNMIVYYELADPIRTPLTAEELAEIEKLQTFYPVTNISNDFNCGMDVMYMADAKSYIDNRLAQIERALIANI